MFNLTDLMPLLSDSYQSNWNNICLEELCSLGLSPKYLGQLTTEKAKAIVKERIRDIDHPNDITRAPEYYCQMLDGRKPSTKR